MQQANLDTLFVRTVRQNFASWDAIVSGSGDDELTIEEVSTLMGRTQFDASIENAPNEEARTQAIQRVAAVVTLKAHFDFIRELYRTSVFGDSTGITRFDLLYFLDALNGTAGAAQATKAREVNQAFANTIDRITAAYNGRATWREVYGERNNNIPVLRWDRVTQGQVGDCYFVAAVVGLARARPGDISITTEEDGRYRVTFPGRSPVFVDRPTYAEMAFYSSAGANGMWVSILCKAYGTAINNAAWFYRTTNPFDAAGNGGYLETGIRAVTGHNAITRNGGINADGNGNLVDNDGYNRAATIADIQAALAANRVITCATASAAWPFVGPDGLALSHAFTITAYDPNLNGGTATIRNPWGQDGANRFGGTFSLQIDTFRAFFAQICFEQAQ